MKKAYLLLPLLAIVLQVAAQTNKVMELKQQLNNHPRQDTFRVNRLNDLAAYAYIPIEERKKYADDALKISQKIHYARGEGNTRMLLGSLLLSKKDTLKSRLMFHLADSIAKSINDPELKINILLLKADLMPDIKAREYMFQQADSIAKKTGNLYLQAKSLASLAYYVTLSDSKKGLNYYLLAEKICIKSGNKSFLSRIQNRIGHTYQVEFSDYVNGMEYFLKAVKSSEEANDLYVLVFNWISIGALYASMEDPDNTFLYLKKAEDANKILKNNIVESDIQNAKGQSYRISKKYPEAALAYNLSLIFDSINSYINISNLADVYYHLNDLSLAFKYAFMALKVVKKMNAYPFEAWIYGILSRTYLKKNMADSAIFYATHGLVFARKSGSLEFMRDNTLALANAYAYKKNFKKAYDNHLLYHLYQDSMLSAEVHNKAAIQQYNFNLDKKQAQIDALNLQKKNQRNTLIAALIVLLLIIAVALVLLRNNRQKIKANKLLHQQKLEIDKKAQNVELLSEIGRKITSTLSVEKIISTVYDNVNALMDANIFGIGIYNDNLKIIEFPATFENGKQLPFYTNAVEDKNRFGAVCFSTGKEIIMGNLNKEYQDYIQQIATQDKGAQPVSIIFLPLMAKEKKLGVVTVQSFKENAYSDYHLFMLRNIATYTAIAIENAESYERLDKTVSTLKSTQAQLIQSEKMASLGELTAGIAHEIQNPLNFVNNFSEINQELIEELFTERLKPIEDRDENLVNEILTDIKENSEKINHHGKRADAIVKGMLQHSRANSGKKEPTDINALCDEFLRLAYHGMRAKDKSFNCEMKTDYDKSIGKINIVPQDIGRVILNLINNAFYACAERSRSTLNENEKLSANSYQPIAEIKTRKVNDTIEIRVIDNGNGIPEKIKDKIFQPFFTTKPTGQGTGLGLSLSYDIVKAHGGEIKVNSLPAGEAGKEGEGTEFTIHLPAS